MIPKKIHYIWFGGNPLSPLALRCIESWKEQCPDYDIVRWDETNFDISQNRYCRDAYEQGKWAFLSDYARLWVLVHEGGIYMDTDVELLKPLDSFLQEEAFSGFESEGSVPTGLMASRKDFPLFVDLLKDYDDRDFILPDGSLNMTTNVVYITESCKRNGLILNGEKQTVAGFTLYPKDYFCPKDYSTKKLEITPNTHAIHHFDGSWLPAELSLYHSKKELMGEIAPWLPGRARSLFALGLACVAHGTLAPYWAWRSNAGK